MGIMMYKKGSWMKWILLYMPLNKKMKEKKIVSFFKWKEKVFCE